MSGALIVEDSRDSREAMIEWLAAQQFEPVRGAASLEEARERLKTGTYEVILLDLTLPDGDGLKLFSELHDQRADVVVITGHGSIDSAVQAMRAGAADYLTKPVDLPRLEGIVARLRRTQRLRGEVDSLRGQLRRLGRFGRIIGVAEPMQKVYDLVSRVAPTSSTVLITGETGSGKELVAQTVHELSGRSDGPFLPINCGAVAPNLIESELFGHEKGSFTGADRRHRGIFEQADGGSLFLDEITEMPLDLQVKLLRVLETSSLTRIGGDRSLKVQVRLIAASNRNLESAVAEGKLRQDLLYRLNVFPIHVPPLRERPDDIELLANHFLAERNAEARESKTFGRGAIESLRAHGWPGNVRELKNVIERAFIVSGDEITADTIPVQPATPIVARANSSIGALPMDLGTSIADAERNLILFTLDRMSWNKRRAAEVLGISLKTLYNRLNTYGVKGPDKVKENGHPFEASGELA